MKTKKKFLKAVITVLVCVIAVAVFAVLGINAYVMAITDGQIITPEQASGIKDIDCILVLGCGINDDGTPSDMLSDRLRRAVELYEADIAHKLLMSGDHGRPDYNEVGVMKQYAIDSGIPSEDIYMDHAGFSTYESMYRAKEIFQAEKIIIVTQEYHLYRALYIAEKLGIEAYGVASDQRTYTGQLARELRETVARCKDFAKVFFKPEPTYLGEEIPVSGNGDITNDY